MNIIAKLALAYAKRTPFGNISSYMERYWLVPYASSTAGEGCGPVSPWKRPIAWLLQRFDIAVRIHVTKRSDLDRDLHDHPWKNISVILSGSYLEEMPRRQWHHSRYDCVDTVYRRSKPGHIRVRKATDRHRLVIVDGNPVVSLFITFKKTQGWGFYTAEGKVPHREYARSMKP